MSKPPEILDLEKAYGITLEETKDEDDIMKLHAGNLYLLNAEQEVIGLKLNRNQISEIKGLEAFTSLRFLSLVNNNISEIKNLENLISLQQLDISVNQITEIKNLNKLVNLQKLYILGNQITEIKNLESLRKLQILFISDNQISEIKNLDQLNNLQELNISDNQISEIKNLEKLTNLQKLDISANQISEIKNLDQLNNLQKLFIIANQISEIKNLAPLLKLTKLSYLTLSSNPFVTKNGLLLEHFDNHLNIIKGALQRLAETQITIKLPVKVMLLGNHASGKSTLLKYLQTQQCSKVDPDKNTSTHVLSVVHSKEIINYELPKAIFYDFGGQDYYHGVYQAFFTQEAVNLLVWNPESDTNSLLIKDSNEYPTRNYNRMYWLAQLKYSFQKQHETLDDYDDPLLLIQTFADQYSKKNNLKEVLLIPNLIDQFHVSLSIDYQNSKNNTALSFLTATFWDTIAQHTDEKEVPEWYPEFLKYILNETQENALSLNLIIEYYKRENLSDEEKRTYLKEDLEQLARKGLLLYYKNDDALNDVAWLNPSATVSNIHDTILSKKIIKEKGKLSKEDFQELNIDTKIEHLLLNEKILFFDEGYQEYIIPNYLPLALENDNNYDLLKYEFDKPAFVLKFERFIPFGLINQLICHYGQNPDRKQYWRNQLIFTLNREFKVWIQLNFSRLTISVSIKPKIQDNQKLNDCVQEIFIGIILLYWGKDISEIKDMGGFNHVFSGTFQREATKLQQYKAIFDKALKPEDLYISIDNKYFVRYNTLNDPERTKESIISYELPENENNLNKNKIKSQHSYIYSNYTDNKNIEITSTESMQSDSNTTNKKRVKKIFISYSRKDVEYKDELRKHLNMLKLFDVADNWSCEDITMGKWNNQIQKELKESDLVIFMMSVNFFNSPYILYQEVQKTIDEIKINPNKKIYSILVSKFAGLENYDQTNLNEKQKAILKLSDYQFGTYFREKNHLTGNMEERLITLNEARRLGILDEQLTKIAEKIMKEMK